MEFEDDICDPRIDWDVMEKGAGPRIVHVAPTVVDGSRRLPKRDEPSRVLVIQNEEFDLVVREPRLGIVYQSLQIHRDGRRLVGRFDGLAQPDGEFIAKNQGQAGET
ncbi:MAG: hypothetical protein NTAFB01_13670 [Nitrospira sp.]